MTDDFLDDVIKRIASAIESTSPEQRADALRAVERELRHTWGGDRVTIRVRNDERDDRIRREYQRSASTKEIADRYDLSRRHVLRIVRRW